jgi:hypothetical protein
VTAGPGRNPALQFRNSGLTMATIPGIRKDPRASVVEATVIGPGPSSGEGRNVPISNAFLAGPGGS